MKSYINANLRFSGSTQKDLADWTGISINTIKSYCSGRRPLESASYRHVRKICDYFGFASTSAIFRWIGGSDDDDVAADGDDLT